MGAFPYALTVSVEAQAEPLREALEQNAPNPFNGTTSIRFATQSPGHASLTIYSVDGQIVRSLLDKIVPAGHHTVVWRGRDDEHRDVSSGVYLYRLTSARGTLIRRMVLVR